MPHKILVVDDDNAFLNEMQGFLQEAGYEVKTCQDSTKDLSTLADEPAECVLLDYHMPNLDGLDLLHVIHAKHPEIPVIICSGFLETRNSYFFKEGAYDILMKPFTPQILFETLNRALSHESEDMTPVLLQGYDLRNAHELVAKKLIIKALSKSSFNVTHAAQLLGISRQGLNRYMKRYKITF